jgi:hypothetical protein
VKKKKGAERLDCLAVGGNGLQCLQKDRCLLVFSDPSFHRPASLGKGGYGLEPGASRRKGRLRSCRRALTQ